MKGILGASFFALSTLISLSIGTVAKADSLASYCTYVEHGSSQPTAAMPCVFSQQQGFIGISWEDGVYNSFEPYDAGPGQYLDQRGGLVYRQFDQRGADLSFQMEQGTIHVYWGGAPADS